MIFEPVILTGFYNSIIIIAFILLDKWSPALQIRTVLLSIQALLSAPNPDDPLANDVAELWKVLSLLYVPIYLIICVPIYLIIYAPIYLICVNLCAHLFNS